jgi:hypothetical protein
LRARAGFFVLVLAPLDSQAHRHFDGHILFMRFIFERFSNFPDTIRAAHGL